MFVTLPDVIQMLQTSVTSVVQTDAVTVVTSVVHQLNRCNMFVCNKFLILLLFTSVTCLFVTCYCCYICNIVMTSVTSVVHNWLFVTRCYICIWWHIRWLIMLATDFTFYITSVTFYKHLLQTCSKHLLHLLQMYFCR